MDNVIFLLAGIVIIGAFLFVIITFGKRPSKIDVEKYRTRWMTIEQSLNRDNKDSYALAVLNGDKLVDQALKDLGYRGKTMGERLKSTRGVLSNRDSMWKAHKLRNRIAHEPDFNIKFEQARGALAGFKRALKDLGAI